MAPARWVPEHQEVSAPNWQAVSVVAGRFGKRDPHAPTNLEGLRASYNTGHKCDAPVLLSGSRRTFQGILSKQSKSYSREPHRLVKGEEIQGIR